MRLTPLHFALASLALLATACGGGSSPVATGPANELLGRKPDRVIEERGLLRPDGYFQWKQYGISGWDLVPDQTDGERPFVRTKQPSARLNLPVLELKDRTIEVEISAPTLTAGQHTELTLYLNDRALRPVLKVGPTVKTFRVHAERALWLNGANVLDFRVEERTEAGVKHWDKVLVWTVRYGAERGVDVALDSRTAQLAPGAGLSYLVECRAPAVLALTGTSQGEGQLELTLSRVTPRTGTAVGEPLLSRGAVSISELRKGYTFELPDVGDDLLSIEMRWQGRTKKKLQLKRANVHSPNNAQRPPVVFISIDTLSARHLSVYGYGRNTSPRLTELAEDAVVFERCIANAPWTLPSYLSVLTGLYPGAHQMDIEIEANVDQHSWDSYQIAPSRWTLAEMLRARGYRTVGYVDTHWLTPKFRVDQGFDIYDFQAALVSLVDPTGGIDLIHDRSRKWLDGLRPSDPFFMFIHAEDVHGPYFPGEGYIDHFAEPPPPEGFTHVLADSAFQTYQSMPHWMAATNYPTGPVPERIPLEPVVQRYDETIHKTDDFIGRILDDLKDRGLYDGALIVISADHGESFAHEFYSHGAMWEDIVHVPLIMKLPGQEFGGTRVESAVQLVDLFPTVMDIAGLPLRDYLHGRSLMPLVRSENTAPVPLFSVGGHCEQYLIGEGDWKLTVEYPGRGSQNVSILTHPRTPPEWLAKNFPEIVDRSLTDALFKKVEQKPGFERLMIELRGILAGPYIELYNVRDDPHELTDVLADHPEVGARLRKLLEKFQAQTQQAQGEAVFAPPSAGFGDEALAALEALGYVESSAPRSEDK